MSEEHKDDRFNTIEKNINKLFDLHEDHSKSINEIRIFFVEVKARVSFMEKEIIALVNKFHDYVTKNEFSPVKTIVFSLAGMIMIAVIVAVLKMVIK